MRNDKSFIIFRISARSTSFLAHDYCHTTLWKTKCVENRVVSPNHPLTIFKMLVEIIECALWLCSLFAPDTSRMRSNSESLAENTNVEFREIEISDKDNYISKEYDGENYANLSSDYFVPSDSSQYGTNWNGCQNRGKVWRTFCKCFWMNLNIIVASIIPIAFFITLVYVVMNTIHSCLEWQNYNNSTLPLSVKRAHAFGDSMQAIVTYLWFPLTMMILFGWKEFKSKFSSTVYVGVIFSELVVIYEMILIQFNAYATNSYYRYPPHLLFCISLFCFTFLIVYNLRN